MGLQNQRDFADKESDRMTTPRAAVHLQSMQIVHGMLVRALTFPYTNEQLTFTQGSSRSHILWLLGHLVWAYDAAVGSSIGLKPMLPPRYSELFAFSTKPSTNVADYPPLEELLARANECFERACARIATLTEAELAAPLSPHHPLAKAFPSLDHFLSMGPFHTGYHLGQIGLLRAAQGMPSLVGM